ncbi:hypothetical protein [Dysgonomonas sp. 511]|uniref:hypothetical protein n=1 Tax=Dysgonomonas sp. 511 TaxID=2302930 RepID=UPI0013D40987|nr:hypothetical protein [Dysgonomonas sp. 511]NDV77844.1 hypothetical protein [Dysgonomonas sp. 511]
MKAKFIARVMQIMNELGWNDTESNAFIGSDTTKVKGHIESVFVDAWRKAVNMLPKTYFTINDFSNHKLVPDVPMGTGYIVLPEDFYILASFKMKGWQVAAETLIDSSDPIARIQANEYTRGNVVRPVCVLNSKGIKERIGENITLAAKNVIEYYSLPKGYKHIVEEALYIPLIPTLDNEPRLSDKLFVPLAYLCASQVFYIFEKPDIAQVLENKATEIIH